MAKIEFTGPQKNVIETRGSNILVSAAAGSGKTEVLTQRILSIITDSEHPVDIDRMLILTFTKAAAAEMRERIGREIAGRLRENPMDQNLWRQQSLLMGAQITTIDSFCLFVIRNNFSDIGIDPGFRIMDEGEGKLLISDVVSDLFDRHFEDENDTEFRHLVDCYCRPGNEKNLEDILVKLYEFVMSDPDYESWIEKAADSYLVENIDDICELSIWKKTENVRKTLLLQAQALMKEAVSLCNSEDGPNTYLPTMASMLTMIEGVINAESYKEAVSYLYHSEIPALSRAKAKGEDPDKRERCKKNRDAAKAITDELKKYYYLECSDIAEESKYIKRVADELLLLLKQLISDFSVVKRDKNVLSFADMEHFALNILTTRDENGNYVPTKSALEYRDYFEAIMVDEYQDSNYVQEYILKSIARDNNYFMVGDIKQSIYGFRQASPEIFAGKYNSFTPEGINKRIDLSSNFRSRQQVVDFVNYIFEVLMNPLTSSVPYDENARLDRKATYPEYEGGDSEVILIEKDTDSIYSKNEAEALYAVNRINRLIANGFLVFDKETKEMRPVRYRDIVILLRSPKDIDLVFKRVLDENGIPAYINTKTGYFGTFEIRTLLNYLTVLDNPIQDIALYGTLTSFFGGFTDEEMAVIKGANPSKGLYDALISYEGSQELTEKIKDFFEALTGYRKLISYMGVRALIEKIMEDTGYLGYMRAFPDGDRRLANIYALLEKAGAFEKTSYHGLFHFVRYIGELKAKEVDFGEAGTVDENADVVRIMSVHGSKGLEFPVCILAGCGKDINKLDSRSSILYSTEGGIGFDYINPETREKRGNLQKRLLSRKIDTDGMCEEIRVLYVALTRAKEKLIVTGEVNDAEKMLGDITGSSAFSYGDIISCKNYMELILRGLYGCGKLEKYVSSINENELTAGKAREKVKTDILKEQLLGSLGLNIAGKIDEGQDSGLKESGSKESGSKEAKLREEILKHLRTTYRYENLKGLYVKTSVSELKKAAFEEEEPSAREFTEQVHTEKKIVPAFARNVEGIEAENRGPVYGSAMHRIMELVPFAEITEENAVSIIKKTMEESLENGRLSEEFAELINIKVCAEFLNSELGKRMTAADKKGLLFKERSFFYGIDADRVKPEFPKEEMMLIQGVIDGYFEEDGQIVVMDYKTDRVEDSQELVKRYRKQLDIYSEALSNILGKKVKEKVIYSFSLKEIINIE